MCTRYEVTMQEFIISLMDRFGYPGILFLITLENVFPPIPSEVILTLGGFMTTYTSMSILGVVLFSTFGSLLGAIILYCAGKLLNEERMIRLVSGKVGRILRFHPEDVCRSMEWFQKKGNKTVFICRFIPILRSLISIPAGMSKMEPTRFLIYTTAGSIIWNAVLVVLGSIVGENWTQISEIFGKYSFVTRLILLGTVALFFYKHYAKKKK